MFDNSICISFLRENSLLIGSFHEIVLLKNITDGGKEKPCKYSDYI